jgi:hypothetical protein
MTGVKTVLDRHVDDARDAQDVFNNLKIGVETYSSRRLKASRNAVKIVDVIISIGLIPMILYLSKKVTNETAIQITAICVAEMGKFYISSRFKLFNRLQLFLFKILTQQKRKEMSKLSIDLASVVENKYYLTEKGIWN